MEELATSNYAEQKIQDLCKLRIFLYKDGGSERFLKLGSGSYRRWETSKICVSGLSFCGEGVVFHSFFRQIQLGRDVRKNGNRVAPFTIEFTGKMRENFIGVQLDKP